MTENKHILKNKIPEFKSREEEAEFWDTHDTADFEDELKPVEIHFADESKHRIIIDLDQETFVKLSQRPEEGH